MSAISSSTRNIKAAVLYLNYFLHGIGCSVLGQSLIKDSLSAQWSTTAMAITAISAALGLGRLIALPIAGPVSDRFGRKWSIIIGGLCYAVYLIGLGVASCQPTGYLLAYLCAIVGGVANSFLDTGIYPALSELFPSAPSASTMGVKFSMGISQMLLPYLMGISMVHVGDFVQFHQFFIVSGVLYLVLVGILCFLPMDGSSVQDKKESLWTNLRHTRFTLTSVALILIGFTCTGTFQLWLNCAQNYAKDIVMWQNPSVMQIYYSVGTLLAVVVTAYLTRRIQDVRFLMLYPFICLVTLAAVVLMTSQTVMIVGAFAIGWAGAGGLLQIATSVCNTTFPQIKGTVTALVMIASSACNYTLLTLASQMTAHGVMLMNLGVTLMGLLLGVYVNVKTGTQITQRVSVPR